MSKPLPDFDLDALLEDHDVPAETRRRIMARAWEDAQRAHADGLISDAVLAHARTITRQKDDA